MSSSGSNPIDPERIVNDVIDVAVNYATWGAVGYKDGKLSEGISTQAVRAGVRGADEGLGEITGRNLAREQLNFQKQQIADEKARLDKQRKDALTRTQQQDMAASQAAAGARVRNPQLAKLSVGQDVLGDQQDFLGV